MEKKDIQHLASLSRIRITDEEAEALKSDIESVLSYVSVINTLGGDGLAKEVGARYNVFRNDVATNEGGAYTEAILNEAPSVKGKYLQVKKILQMD